jgi:hypothetical protein
LFSNQWINFKLFADSDGKQKAFILSLNENKEGKACEDMREIQHNFSKNRLVAKKFYFSIIFR